MNKVVLVLLIIPFFIGCKKSDRDEDDNIATATDLAVVNGYIFNTFKLVHQASLTTNGINNSFPDSNNVLQCDTIHNTSNGSLSIKISFNAGCSYNGNTYNGDIIVGYSDFYDNSGSLDTVTFNNFSINGYNFYDGYLTINNKDTIDGIQTYWVKYYDVKLNNGNNQHFFYSGVQTYKQTEGTNSATFTDDAFDVSGNISGRSFQGNEFSAEITTPLMFSGDCSWVSSGSVKVTPNSKHSRIVDYGSGCDNTASVQLYEITTNITLP